MAEKPKSLTKKQFERERRASEERRKKRKEAEPKHIKLPVVPMGRWSGVLDRRTRVSMYDEFVPPPSVADKGREHK